MSLAELCTSLSFNQTCGSYSGRYFKVIITRNNCFNYFLINLIKAIIDLAGDIQCVELIVSNFHITTSSYSIQF